MKRNAAGMGSIRRRDDDTWEARFTIPESGRRVSVYGKTQKEVKQKLKAALAELDGGKYQEPTRMTVGAWLELWEAEYLGDVKKRTQGYYKDTVRLHIKPALGNIKLQGLTAAKIQTFYNRLHRDSDGTVLHSPKTIRNIHGILHRALNDAVAIGYLRFNPSTACKLPKTEKADIHPFDEEQITAFLEAIKGTQFEAVLYVTLFCGLRQGEILGLTWDCVDFNAGNIVINKQLQRARGEKGAYDLLPVKNSKPRYLVPPASVMETLRREQIKQYEARLKAGAAWQNKESFVFTNATGEHLSTQTVYKHFKALATSIGAENTRFHDLRHSYAVLSLQSGDDIKTVQENLGHHTAAFTLDTYAHVTQQMKRDSANRMEQRIKELSGG